MGAKIIDGKAIAAKIRQRVRAKIAALRKQGKRPPGLAVILVGHDPASSIYVRNKRQACEEVGILSSYHPLPADISQNKLIRLIEDLNADPTVDGILLQLPLPKHIQPETALECIKPEKDIDGFHPYNLGRLAQYRPLLEPCTPHGIMLLLQHIKLPCKSKHAVILGSSNIVGKPLIFELLAAGCTITICNSLTKNLSKQVGEADILVSAIGKPGFVKGKWIKKGATVIDVGITQLPDGSVTGDIEFEAAKAQARWITPVPGGVGPMTVAVLLSNTLEAYSLA